MSSNDLSGRRILVIVTNYGVEQDELLVPVRRLREDGASVDIAAASSSPVSTLVHDKNPGQTVQPTLNLADVDPDAYDLLIVPGGTINADTLRLNDTAVGLVKAFATTRRPVAAICHGLWLLVEAGLVADKTLTSYMSLSTDIRNAGGNWVDKSVVADPSGGWTLISSRNPGDLPDFIGEIRNALL